MPSIPRRTLLQGISSAIALASLPTFAKPLPPMQWDVLAFGARGDGSTKDTAAIQQAIDACAKAGGGRVLLPAGHIFLSGSLNLRSHVELYVEAGATLRASPDRDDFRKLGALILADHADNIAISGDGTIDGDFHAFLKDRQEGGYAVPQPFLGPFDPLYDKPGKDHPDGRPRIILLVGCRGARLRDFTIIDSPTWTIHLLGCEDLRISGITILNSFEVPNCDGIDIDHCRSVRISDCTIHAGDDCLVLKASRNFREFGICEDIVITNCTLQSSSAAIKIEAEGPDTIRRATISNCTIDRSNRGIALNNRDGSLIEDMIFSDMTIQTELRPVMWWGSGEPIAITNLARTHGVDPGRVRNLQFHNFTCRGENGILLEGMPGHPLENLSLRDIDLTIEKTSVIPGGYYDLRPGDDGEGVEHRPIAGVRAIETTGLTLNGIHVSWAGPQQTYFGPALELRNARRSHITDFTGGAGTPGQTNRIETDVTDD